MVGEDWQTGGQVGGPEGEVGGVQEHFIEKIKITEIYNLQISRLAPLGRLFYPSLESSRDVPRTLKNCSRDVPRSNLKDSRDVPRSLKRASRDVPRSNLNDSRDVPGTLIKCSRDVPRSNLKDSRDMTLL